MSNYRRRKTISRDCRTDVAATATAATERLKDYPEFNQAEYVVDPIQLRPPADNPFCRLTVRPSLLNTMTDGTRTWAAAAAQRIMSRLVIAEMSSRPRPVSASSFCPFFTPVIWWLSFIGVSANGSAHIRWPSADKLLSLRKPTAHRWRLTRHLFYLKFSDYTACRV